MANQDKPRGLEVYGELLRANEYIASAAIYPGDMVKLGSDGKVSRVAASDAGCGVALSYASADGQKVLVADHPDQRFIIQCDDASIAAQTNLNLNYDIIVGSADTTYKRSGMELDGSTGANTATLQLRALQVNKEINNAFGANVDVIVQINYHQLDSNTAGV